MHYKNRPPPIAQICDGINNRGGGGGGGGGSLYLNTTRGWIQIGDSRNTSRAGFTDLNPAPRGLSYQSHTR